MGVDVAADITNSQKFTGMNRNSFTCFKKMNPGFEKEYRARAGNEVVAVIAYILSVNYVSKQDSLYY